MDNQQLLKEIRRTSYISGNFSLRSGKSSDRYFDKYSFESSPVILKQIAIVIKKSISKEYDFLAGLEMGGIPIATAVSLETGIPCLFIRKEAKKYGTCKFAEGGDVEGKTLLIIEDIVTSGGAVIDAVKRLRRNGAFVSDVQCVIDRESGGEMNLKKYNLDLFSLFKKSEFE